ncbi:MAG: DUF502 domain-containing protein [Chitinophagales bacterium]|nr:DUF502 domain-containing protein [Chitinophagales bacterium]MDW8393798.1 DUF502 domain-containing protein [Chitinophagales bacterium]
MRYSLKDVYRTLLNYFLRGLLFLAPIFITVYAIYLFLHWADTLLDNIFPRLFPGAGILLLIAFIAFIGFLTKLFLFQFLMDWMEELLSRNTLTKLVYTSIRDLISAFVGDNKKRLFTEPVMVLLFAEAGIQKLGFITKSDLASIGIKDMVAVYFPHSYNFSGNLYLVPRQNITPLPDFNAADAMKFIVSGGIAGVE